MFIEFIHSFLIECFCILKLSPKLVATKCLPEICIRSNLPTSKDIILSFTIRILFHYCCVENIRNNCYLKPENFFWLQQFFLFMNEFAWCIKYSSLQLIQAFKTRYVAWRIESIQYPIRFFFLQINWLAKCAKVTFYPSLSSFLLLNHFELEN